MYYQVQPTGKVSRRQGREGRGGGRARRPEWRRHGRVACVKGLGQAIAREWRRPGLLTECKRTPKEKESKYHKTSEDNKRQDETGAGEAVAHRKE